MQKRTFWIMSRRGDVPAAVMIDGYGFNKSGYCFGVYKGERGKWRVFETLISWYCGETDKLRDAESIVNGALIRTLDSIKADGAYAAAQKELEKHIEAAKAAIKTYRYGMRHRGFSPGAQPTKGLVDCIPDPAGDYWDILVYDHRLTDGELGMYELDDLNPEDSTEDAIAPEDSTASTEDSTASTTASAADASIDTTTSAAESAADKEDTMVTYERDAIVCKGVTFEATYNISVQGAVLCFAILARQGGRARKAKLVITPDHADFPAALEAAKAHLQAHLSPDLYKEAIARLDSPQEIPETAQAAPETVQASQAAQDAAQAPQAAPERPQEPQAVQATAREPQEAVQATQGPRKASAGSKDFIGTEIRGDGWRIVFDGDLQRTRVIFPDAAPSPAVQAAVEQAGFYYSRSMGSWNKKLTCKAHRAALALAEELTRICGAA